MALRSITIENYGRIGVAQTVPIRPITLLYGPIGSGKSTIMMAINQLREAIINKDRDNYFITGRCFSYGYAGRPCRIAADFEVGDVSGHVATCIEWDSDDCGVAHSERSTEDLDIATGLDDSPSFMLDFTWFIRDIMPGIEEWIGGADNQDTDAMVNRYLKKLTGYSLYHGFSSQYKKDRWMFADEIGPATDVESVGCGVAYAMNLIYEIIRTKEAGPSRRPLYIEYPEMGIDYRTQLALADLLIDGMRPERPLFLETHSEHILRRLLRRVRETTQRRKYDTDLRDADLCGNDSDRGEPPLGPDLTPDDLSVVDVRAQDGGSHVRPIAVTDNGGLAGSWPMTISGQMNEDD